MTGTRPWRAILDAIRLAVDPDGELGVTFASAWVANLATPAILVVPVRRFTSRPDVRWELALQVILGLQGDDDELLFELTEQALALFGPGKALGVVTGDTTFGQDERAGGTYVLSTTTLTA